MAEVVVGVDSSTQSTKLEARDIATGEVVGSGRAVHPATSPPISEQDPAVWWHALSAAMDQLGDVRRRVVALSVAGQQHGLVLVDDRGEVVRPSKLWNDTTSAANAASMVEALGAPAWADRCGSVPVAAFTVTKLAWMIEHEPAMARRTARVMLPHDWLTWKLTGEHVTDRGDASGTGWFNAVTGEVDQVLLATAVDDPDAWARRMPRVLAPCEPAGRLHAHAAAVLGLDERVIVAAGTGDNMAAALGLGLEPGDTAISLGTSGTVYGVSVRPTADRSGQVAGFADATGNYLPLVCTLNATVVTDTVASWLGTDEAGLATLALSEPDRPDQPALVPYLDGERTPNLPNATGTWAGLTRETTRSDLARAAHDGVLCGLLDGRDALVRLGVDTSGEVRLVGGGARSAAYQQRVADLLGQPVVLPQPDELVAAGAAVQASAVVSASPGVSELAVTAERWGLRAGTVVTPKSTHGAAIRARWERARAGGHLDR